VGLVRPPDTNLAVVDALVSVATQGGVRWCNARERWGFLEQGPLFTDHRHLISHQPMRRVVENLNADPPRLTDVDSWPDD
jgi:hypothetical protein